MIDKLTGEQEKAMPRYVEKWLKIGLQTGRINTDSAKKAIAECYTVAQLPPPKSYYFFDSPWSVCLGAIYLRDNSDQVYKQVRDQVHDRVYNHVYSQVRDQVYNQVVDQLRCQVSGQVHDQVSDQVYQQVYSQVSDQVYQQVYSQVRAQVRDQVSDQELDQAINKMPIVSIDKDKLRDIAYGMLNGAQEAYWLSFYDFMGSELGVDFGGVLSGLISAANSCGAWLAFEGVAFASHHPDFIKFDDRQRLHCSDGPAIKYRDGFAVYAWHGTRIPAEWIESKDELRAKDILNHENIEERRAGIEIIGWDKILDECNCTKIDEDESDEIGVLLEANIEGVGKERFLKVKCGTGRHFVLPVPPEMTTALEANLWTYGLDADRIFIPQVRT